MCNLCKNCNAPVNGNYCEVCGQAANTKRINLSYLLTQIQFIYLDHGLFFTLKRLFTKPGEMIKGYLAGKRVQYFKPFSLVFILATVYTVLSLWFDARIQVEVLSYEAENNLNLVMMRKYQEFIYSYFAYILLFSLPALALSTFLVFRKNGYNYAEHLTINTYASAGQIVLYILTLFTKFFMSVINGQVLAIIITSVYAVWVYVMVFKRSSWIKCLFKSIFAVILQTVFVVLIMSIVCLLYLIISFGIKQIAA